MSETKQKMRWREIKLYFCKYCILTTIGILIFFNYSFSQTSEKDSSYSDGFVFFPKQKNDYRLSFGGGISISKLPKFIVDDEINQSPMANLFFKFYLPYDFSLNSQIQSNYLTNYFSFGAGWSLKYKNASATISDNYALWFGQANFNKFDVSVSGRINNPSLTLGYQFSPVFLSLKYDLIILTHLTQDIAGMEVLTKKPQIVGNSVTFIIEEPLWKKNTVYLGLKIYYTKYFYQSWLAFSERERWLLIPEFMMGIVL